MKTRIVKKPSRGFIPMIRSRHPSHNVLRGILERLSVKSVIRFGSTTELPDTIANGGTRIEINSTNSIKNSSSKLKMKQCFDKGEVSTAKWMPVTELQRLVENNQNPFEFPIVMKHHFGSRGTGNSLVKSTQELKEWFKGKTLDNYIAEQYHNYNKEYRLHVTKNGCFYSCRKMLKQDFKNHPNAWQRHDDNCVWILEENPQFEKPNNWEEIVNHCVKALTSCGLDIGACDLRVQSNTDSKGSKRDRCDFIVVEINSAPSFGDVTAQKYKEELPKLIKSKI